ncbi:MAG: hypothetical protein ACJ8AD_03815 [Gemmatimonadaceae bacterium]
MKTLNRLARVAPALAILVAAAPVAQAQGITSLLPHVAVGGVGSTLGLGGDVAIGIGNYIVIRGARNVGSIGMDQTVQSQAYNLFAKADNRSLMLDVHPFGGGIFVSVGKVQNHSTIALTGTPTNGSYTFNGQSYAADSVGNLIGAVRLPENPMFFGFGWDHTFGNAWGASITSRLGVLHQDKAQLDLSATGPYGQASNPAHAQFQAQLDAERASQEASLDKSVVRNLPVLEIGLRVRLF